MSKKPLILLIIIAVAIVVLVLLVKMGVIKIEAFSETTTKQEIESVKSIPLLESGKVYVYHGQTLEKDAEGYAETEGEFEECGYTTIGFEIAENYRKSGADKTRAVWVNQDDEAKVPVLDANNGDKLVYAYLSTKEILPISLERYYDNGYTIGVSNLTSDDGGHIMLTIKAKEQDAKTYINLSSDAMQVNDLARQYDEGVIYLDAIGGKKITSDNLTAGGAVQGLEKGKSYVCNFYTGTYFQDFVLTADNRCYSGFPYEFFTLYKYDFLHSNIIEIELPDYLKSGYYFVNGLGMFRYIAKGDTMDSPTDSPIIIVDEDGKVENPELYSYGKIATEAETKETTAPAAKEATSAASTEPVRRYTYETGEGKKAIITANVGGVSTGTPAQMIVTAPDGTSTSVDENNGSMSYTNEQSGMYQIVIANVAGRDVQIVTE